MCFSDLDESQLADSASADNDDHSDDFAAAAAAAADSASGSNDQITVWPRAEGRAEGRARLRAPSSVGVAGTLAPSSSGQFAHPREYPGSGYCSTPLLIADDLDCLNNWRL